MKIILDKNLLKNISRGCITAKAINYLSRESDNGMVKVVPSETNVEVEITDGFIVEIMDTYLETMIAGLGMALGYKAALERMADNAKSIIKRYKKEESQS